MHQNQKTVLTDLAKKVRTVADPDLNEAAMQFFWPPIKWTFCSKSPKLAVFHYASNSHFRPALLRIRLKTLTEECKHFFRG